MNAKGIVIATHPIDIPSCIDWEARIENTIEELQQEYGGQYYIAANKKIPIDFLFIFYPAELHEWVASEKIVETIVNQRIEYLAEVHLTACGNDPKDAQISPEDVRQLVNDQCVRNGFIADSMRALTPEETGAAVRELLVRRHSRLQLGTAAGSLSTDVTRFDDSIDGAMQMPAQSRGAV